MRIDLSLWFKCGNVFIFLNFHCMTLLIHLSTIISAYLQLRCLKPNIVVCPFVGIPMGTNCAPLLIAAHVWKIYDFKIEVVPFIINFSTDVTTVVKFEVQVQKWCGRSGICGLFNFQLWRIYQLHPRNRLLDQGYKKIRLIRSLKKFIFRYQDLVEIYSVSAEKIINDGFSRIIATGPCIANQLRDVNTICRRSWYIAAHIWKIYDFKIEET
jgi:hypothetical protein